MSFLLYYQPYQDAEIETPSTTASLTSKPISDCTTIYFAHGWSQIICHNCQHAFRRQRHEPAVTPQCPRCGHNIIVCMLKRHEQLYKYAERTKRRVEIELIPRGRLLCCRCASSLEDEDPEVLGHVCWETSKQEKEKDGRPPLKRQSSLPEITPKQAPYSEEMMYPVANVCHVCKTRSPLSDTVGMTICQNEKCKHKECKDCKLEVLGNVDGSYDAGDWLMYVLNKDNKQPHRRFTVSRRE